MMAYRPSFASITVCIVSLALLSGCGITAPRGNPGYANLDSLGLADTDRVMSLSFGPGLLRFAARHTGDDPETQALLRGLDGVRVRIYEVNGSADNVAVRMATMGTKLQAGDWQPVMQVQEAGELTQVFLKADGDSISGLVVMALDDSEAVVVNIMGDLQPEMFSDTMVALDVDRMPNIQVDSTNTLASIDP